MNNVLAMILAGGQGDRLSILSEQRAKPAVVFGGQYRIVDFALSNCSNSGITKVSVLTQYRPRSLVNHIGAGRPWGFDTLDGGIQILQPYLGRADSDWYQGTADAIYQNLYVIEESRAREVLILAGDHIYLTSYRNMIAYHRSQAADATVAVYSVPREEAHRFGVLDLDANGRIIDFQEKPKNPRGAWASMGVYVFNKDVLVEQLQSDADMGENSSHDFGKDIIPRIFQTHRVFGYQYQSYWRDVGTIESYWTAHMDLLAPNPSLNLEEAELKLRTAGAIMPPARFGRGAMVRESLISPAVHINGEVTRSVISPGVVIEEGAVVRDSIIQHRCVIRAGAVVDRSILDKEVTVGRGSIVGEGDAAIANFERPDIVNTGINVIGKRVTIPAGMSVGRNVVIGPGVHDELVERAALESGASVHPTTMPLHLFV
ncbi:MAG: NTP transferase domain-containing protein [Dehalococcoidia bacterium]|jgi:glucose-1-phosphate adenylyltransferase|uniref:glucose-1-phosphate adenylyltransferase family protein n=1 Tax=Candidatus Amarobacter glycogenicus TaxID=3140699 RepID=UPI002A0F9E69|nr:NTP transferase domain-containing protein [Dehalococcoidia bacterium]MBK9612149.1 NTP transferase domain-containing protein [Dehalococcoidia bacterium]